MRLGMQRFRSAQLYASAASLFVELPWVQATVSATAEGAGKIAKK